MSDQNSSQDNAKEIFKQMKSFMSAHCLTKQMIRETKVEGNTLVLSAGPLENGVHVGLGKELVIPFSGAASAHIAKSYIESGTANIEGVDEDYKKPKTTNLSRRLSL